MPDEFSDTNCSACKGRNAEKQQFNESLPHTLIITTSPPVEAQLQNHWRSLSRQILQLPDMPAVAQT
jgi:hypothetical protein